jgi:hypothetical protein
MLGQTLWGPFRTTLELILWVKYLAHARLVIIVSKYDIAKIIQHYFHEALF